MAGDKAFMEKLTALCKRRGFIYQSSEIYGGISGFWDYGPLGVELKRNIKDQWWHDMVTNPPTGPDGKEIEMVGVDCSIIMNPKVWEASGHVGGFSDPMVDCKECKGRFRADQVWIRHAGFFSPDGNWVPLEFRSVVANSKGEVDDMLGSEPSSKLRRKAGSATVKFVCDVYDKLFGLSRELNGAVTLDDGRQIPANWRDETPCPECEKKGELTEPRQFNLMFETYVGALQNATSKAYLRPETAQGIFVNFKNVLDTARVKVPFGMAQVGKAFRNEINPRNYTFRSREFEQMEIEFFCHPDRAMEWYEFWREVRYNWYINLGLKSEKLRLRDQTGDELAHYSKACADIEYLFPFSDEHQELEGVAHRGNYDLTQHHKHSGKDLTYFDDEVWERDKDKFAGDKEAAKKAKSDLPYRYLPTVIEPSAGVDRSTLAFLCEAYTEDEAPDDKGKMQSRLVLKFHPKLAPIKAAVFPLVNKEGMPDVAEQICKGIKKHMTAFFDAKGAIGRRYRRQDEAGTPFCVTVDGQTLADGTVTIRDRDTLEQTRVGKEQVVAWLREKVEVSIKN